ncbi:MAG: PA14 domain-containing protein [Planctomycetia bacterium]|nr:PA14 domain-containing protein [Planctomycetia bacterium]
MRKRSWISCAAALALSFGASSDALAQGRLFFTGPYGVGGTYNLYEVRGAGVRDYTPGGRVGRYTVELAAPVSFDTGAAMAQVPAIDGAGAVTEPVSGTAKVAHMGAFSGALAAQEHAFVVQQLQLIGANVLIGLTDDERYGGGESRTRPATGSDPTLNLENGCPAGNCAAEKNSGFAGQPGAAVNDGIGWQWSNDEPYDFQAWNGGGEPNDYATGLGVTAGTGEDATELLTNGLWNDIGDGDGIEDNGTRAYLYEYENRSATPITIPAANKAPTLSTTPLKTPGGTGGNGFVSVRNVHNGATGVSGNNGAVNLLLDGGTVETNTQHATINFNGLSGGAGGSFFGGDVDFPLVTEGALAGGDINNFALRAHGYLVIEEGGDYTFDVATDDSGELWIYDKTFSSATNGAVSPHGSLLFAGDRGHDHTLGVVNLAPGEYEFEYVMNENGGGASAELIAAKGAFTAFSPLDFRLVGGDPTSVSYAGGTTPKTGGQFQITEVLAQPDGSIVIDTLAKAKALLPAGDGDDVVDSALSDTINHSDPFNFAARNAARFAGDADFLTDDGLGFDDNDFVFQAKNTVVITTAGDYTFGFDSDDGAQIILEGAQFTAAFGPGIVTDAAGVATPLGNALTADILTGSSLSAAWTHLEPGEYDIEYTMFERGAGAHAELFVAPGRAPGFSTDLFELLNPTGGKVVGPREIAGAIQFGDGIFDPGQVGDTDGDGDVDITDLNNVRNNFAGAGLGDTDGDNDVDITDLNNVRNNFGAGSPGAHAVPEPSSMVLVGLGLVGLLAARRFRK